MYRTIVLLILFLSFSALSTTADEMIKHKSISIGSYSLNFNYIAGLKPAIVFESGSGVESTHWNKIMKSLSSKVDNAIISYDRAGYGESDLPIEPYQIESEILWLRKGLERLGYADSIVYVGHSYAYYLLKMYEAKYNDSIHSLVYIDPVTIDFIESMGGIEEELKHFDPSLLPDNKFGKSLIRETKGVPDTFNKVKNLKVSDSSSCFVISAESPEWSSQKEIIEWKSGHKKLSRQCGNNIVIAKGSNHDVPTHSPELIVNKLVSILEQ
ncbi:MAG: alpha/beta hydrolase [Colwellia sp.]|nr:alpha/beta hydrolase [Colwellia sp.]